MLAFVCVSVFYLASDTIEKLVFVCLSVCVFVRICVSTGLYHTSLTVSRLLSKNIQGIGQRSRVLTFDVMTYFGRHDGLFDVMTRF